MKICPICQSTYDISVDFCWKDGAPLDVADVDAETTQRVTGSPLPAVLDDMDAPDAISLTGLPAVDPTVDLSEPAPEPRRAALTLSPPRAPSVSDSMLSIPGVELAPSLATDGSEDPSADPFGGHEAELFREAIRARGVATGSSPSVGAAPSEPAREPIPSPELPPDAAPDDMVTPVAPTPAAPVDGPGPSAAPIPAPPVAAPASPAPAASEPEAAPATSATPDVVPSAVPSAAHPAPGAPAAPPRSTTAEPPSAPKAQPSRTPSSSGTAAVSARKNPGAPAEKGGFPIGAIAAVLLVVLTVAYFLRPKGTDAPAPSPEPVAVAPTPIAPEPTPEPPAPTPEPTLAVVEATAEPTAPTEAPTPPEASAPPAAKSASAPTPAPNTVATPGKPSTAQSTAPPFRTSPTPAPSPKPTLAAANNPWLTPSPTPTPAPAPSTSNPWGAPTVTTGSLTVTSQPAGARVAIAGKARGKTPVTVELSAGNHEVRVEEAGYATQMKFVAVGAGKALTVDFPLENLTPAAAPVARPRGTLNVVTVPNSATLFLDGEAKGATPVTVSITAGTHHFRFVVDGGGTTEQTVQVDIKDGESKAQVFTLK
jgi:hypothetical protein